MKILGVETSCDETALCVLKAEGAIEAPRFNVLGTSLFSQIDIHKEYGGVFPRLAKREHGKNLIPLFEKLLRETGLLKEKTNTDFPRETIEKILEKEPDLVAAFVDFISTIERPDIDAIAVTIGPGLEPALWVGVNFARALNAVWNIPVIAVNHMEGHIVSPLLHQKNQVAFPALALLISGGHTELVLIKKWGDYEILGETRDDAVGEAFDKVARMLGLPYPGGPQISRLADQARQNKMLDVKTSTPRFALPRPMIASDNYDFSFSGLKTAVLYTLKDAGTISEKDKESMAREFEDSVTEVLTAKTIRAVEEYNIQSLIIGGGVISNTTIRKAFEEKLKEFPDVTLHIPETGLATDNAVMIAMAGYFNFLQEKTSLDPLALRASANMRLS